MGEISILMDFRIFVNNKCWQILNGTNYLLAKEKGQIENLYNECTLDYICYSYFFRCVTLH